MRLGDGSDRYGAVSRGLHWTMALLFLWQFGGMVAKEVLGRTPLTGFWVGSHASVGLLLFILLLVRAMWALAQRGRRPAYGDGVIGALARIGHAALYALMLVVPLLALLRMFGSGKPVQFFGVMVRPATGRAIDWMTAPANLLHGTLAWLLLLLIAGHVGMVLVHRFWWRDGVAGRMIGSSRA